MIDCLVISIRVWGLESPINNCKGYIDYYSSNGLGLEQGDKVSTNLPAKNNSRILGIMGLTCNVQLKKTLGSILAGYACQISF